MLYLTGTMGSNTQTRHINKDENTQYFGQVSILDIFHAYFSGAAKTWKCHFAFGCVEAQLKLHLALM